MHAPFLVASLDRGPVASIYDLLLIDIVVDILSGVTILFL